MNAPFTKLVQSLPATIPFIAPETLERESGKPFNARIGANESAFGLSPAAQLAISNELQRSAWYGDPENHDLRMALARLHGVSPNEICVDAGIDSLLGLVVRMLVEAGRSVVSSLGAYPTFNYHVAGFGGDLQLVPYRDDYEDPQALIDRAAQTRAPLIYLSNPDNPMGTWHPAQTLTDMIAALPPGSVLALDEAYAEFAPADSLPPIDTSQEQVIRLRTFSKAHGMAGLRVGYAIANAQLISGLNRIRNHFAVNRLAQAAALASLGDPAFLVNVLEQVSQGRDRIARMGQDHGLSAIASATNFVALDLGNAQRAAALRAELQTRGVFVRMPGVAPLNRTIRIGVGSATEQACLEAVFGEALAAADMRSPGASLMAASD